MYKNPTLGADPELFLRNKNDGEYVPCIDIVGGTKQDPNYFTDKGHAMQEDNVMLEFNIPPCKTKDEFVNNLAFSLDYILNNIEDDLGICVIPSVEFEQEVLEHPQAKVSGCDPYFNVYTTEQETVDVEESNIRSAGGHIHVGYDNPTTEKTAKLVKAMDLFLGVPSLFMDFDNRRRETYGKAGMFRFKDYGFEYRSLSNFWLRNEELMGWVWDNTIEAMNFVAKGNEPPVDLNEVINGNQKTEAQTLIQQYGIDF